MPIDVHIILVFLAGACLAATLCGLWFRHWVGPNTILTQYVPKQQFVELQATAQQLTAELNGANVQADYLSQTVIEKDQKILALEQSVETYQQELRAGVLQQTTLQAELTSAERRISVQMADFQKLRQQSRDEFSSLSASMLKQNGEALRDEHSRALKSLLEPVRHKLVEFQQQVDHKFSEESKDKATLKAQIEQLTNLNQDLAREAKQLTQALTGDNKTQGDWGELQLERLLEAAGLSADAHFETQASFRASDGRQQRPDCIIRLPQNRCLIIDCKVSLTAYNRFCGSEEDQVRKLSLKQHVASLKAHIKGLSAKRYQDLYQVTSPDYVLLFVPLEPAFIAAVKDAPSLFTDALAANVVLVSPSTLLATMRTVSYIWQQENQQQNAAEIAEVGAKLYDKFVGFVEDMDNVGFQLNKAKQSYVEAMNKLSRSPKQGTTLLARAEELKKLGVQSKKQLQAIKQ